MYAMRRAASLRRISGRVVLPSVRGHSREIEVPLFLLLLLAALGGSSCAASGAPQPAAVEIASRTGHPVRIVCAGGSDARDMGIYLRGFLSERGFRVNSGIAGSFQPDYPGPQWLLATDSAFRTLGSGIVLPDIPKNARDEAHVLDARRGRNGAVVSLVGKSEAGLRAAVARLVSRAANHTDRLTMEAGAEVNDPFTKMRGIIVGNAGRRQCPEGSPFKDIDFETWPLDKIRAYPALFWQFGFNCVQIAENRGYGSLSGDAFERTRRAVLELAKASRAGKMVVSFDAWGDCPYKEGESYCWNDPTEHKALVEYIEELGATYGPYVDHFNIHIGDPGGCTRNGCDPSYVTSQQITAEYLRVFRKHNPRVMGAMSTWSNAPFWKHSPKPVDLSNYREYFVQPSPRFGVPLPAGVEFLDEAYTPRDVGIALHQTYNDEQSALLVAAGRPVDVWAWYIGDMEMRNNLYIALDRVDEAYSRLPDAARERLRLNTVEIAFHGWPQIINTYCAAQKMWHPRRSMEDIAREFCVAAFGPENADRVHELYRACENGVLVPVPQPPGFGTWDYNNQLSRVLSRARTITIPPGFKPNFAFPVPVQKYVDMLRARLQLTLALSEAKENVDAARSRGASADEIGSIRKRAVESLPRLPIDPLYSQDSTIVVPEFREATYAEMIEAL